MIVKRVVFRQYDGVAPHHCLRTLPVHEGIVGRSDGNFAPPLPRGFLTLSFRVPLECSCKIHISGKVAADLTCKEGDYV